MPLASLIEALLFALAQPISYTRLAELCGVGIGEIEPGLEVLSTRYAAARAGVRLVRNGAEAEIVSAPEASELIRRALHIEMQGELSKASLEALSILAYRGPLTRPEVEQIRGVQSAIILRNLCLRGLVEAHAGGAHGQTAYAVSLEFLKHLGFERVTDLPDYVDLHAQDSVNQILSDVPAAAA